MKNLMEKKMEKTESKLYTYLQLPDDYWIITTTMDSDFEYTITDTEDEDK